MAVLMDVLLVLIVLAAVAVGYRQGLIKMLITFAVVAVAFGVAYSACPTVAETVYDKFLQTKVSSSVDAAILPQDPENLKQAVTEYLGGTTFGFIGSTMDFDAAEIVDTMVFDSAEQVAESIKNDVIRPPAILMLKAVSFAFMFIVLWVLLSVVARLITAGAKLPVINGLNKLAGGTIGLVIGVVLCVGVCAIVELSLRVGSVGIMGFTPEMRDQTVLYRVVANLLTF